jgi:hypothetical protein
MYVYRLQISWEIYKKNKKIYKKMFRGSLVTAVKEFG